MDQKKIITYLVTGLFALFIVFVFVMISFLKENAQCQVDPFVYGAKILNEGLEGPLCSCSWPGTVYESFYFDEEGKYSRDPRYKEQPIDPSTIPNVQINITNYK